MSSTNESQRLSRRAFAAAAAGAAAISPWTARRVNGQAVDSPSGGPPFGKEIGFERKDVPLKVEPFAMTDVRLLPGIYQDSQEANLRYLKRIDADRLLLNFRVNAGIASTAQPLGGWEKPDCELRGHFVGHYLSACALMYASTGDREVKEKGDYIVAELAKCQAKLPDGYLSAFPLEFLDRLSAREKVWAPFYTIHKIMAGMYDMHEYCGNQQALQVLEGMAHWTEKWSGPIPEAHMQDILNTEYGGMNEVLYNLAALTGDKNYAVTGDRFTKKKFFNPLALRRDELRGLHVNTHIPQVIGAARRYEISGDERFHDVADFFWWDVTSGRAYVTGGTSNGEAWLEEPRRLGAELRRRSDTTECCCAYNMLKLTRHLYQWTADPRYFDYYERTLLNHRIAAIDRQTGATQYYLSLVPAAWKTFNTEEDSFWCCTGTGVEEFSKLNGSIYFHGPEGLYVNLFIPSVLNSKEMGWRLRQETDFPETARTTLVMEAAPAQRTALHIRIPHWVGSEAFVKVNGKTLDAVPSPASYFTIARMWQAGDRIEVHMPMQLHVEVMPDEPQTQAFLYGPLVLAGKLGSKDLSWDAVIGPMGPDLKKSPMSVPALSSSLKAVSGKPLTFETTAEGRQITFVPFDRLFGERYSVYWQVG